MFTQMSTHLHKFHLMSQKSNLDISIVGRMVFTNISIILYYKSDIIYSHEVYAEV
jgi:hypothetical protein